MKVVVCDDDVTLRGVATKLAEEAGHEVIAETDRASDAVDLIERFGAEILILDLALPWGTGRDALTELRDRGMSCEVIVFTSYSVDERELRSAGARAVIEKPDFARLEGVLAELRDGPAADPAAADRRETRVVTAPLPLPHTLSPSGLEPPESFLAVVGASELGDAVLVVRLEGIDPIAGDWGELVQADRRLELARNVRGALRVQDRLSTTRGGNVAALLVQGGAAGPAAVFARVQRTHNGTSRPGVLGGGWSVRGADDAGIDVLDRAEVAALTSHGHLGAG